MLFDIKWVEATDDAKHLQCIGQLPATKNYINPYVNSDVVEKPWSRSTIHFPATRHIHIYC